MEDWRYSERVGGGRQNGGLETQGKSGEGGGGALWRTGNTVNEWGGGGGKMENWGYSERVGDGDKMEDWGYSERVGAGENGGLGIQ